jgi:hypothetical protein
MIQEGRLGLPSRYPGLDVKIDDYVAMRLLGTIPLH